jgi:hypothetical protein
MIASPFRRTAAGLLGASLIVALLPQGGWAARPNKIAVKVSDVQGFEPDSGTTPFAFTVSLARASTSTLSVKYATAAGSANDTDFVATSGTLWFAPGVTERTVEVAVKGDTEGEPDERFFLNLSGGGKALRIVDPQGVATILNNDPGSGISVGDVSVREGDAGTKEAVIGLSLSQPAASDLTISYMTADVSASAGADYAGRSASIVVPAGASSAELPVDIIGDKIDENAETFSVEVSEDGATAYLVDRRGIATIVDDDKTATATTLRIRKRPARIVARGRLTPPAPGEKMIVKLLRKRSGRWVLLRRKRPALSAARMLDGASRSTYKTAFARPRKRGVFKIVARYSGNAESRSSKASRRFRLR